VTVMAFNIPPPSRRLMRQDGTQAGGALPRKFGRNYYLVGRLHVNWTQKGLVANDSSRNADTPQESSLNLFMSLPNDNHSFRCWRENSSVLAPGHTASTNA
jgi:hypothetical protein